MTRTALLLFALTGCEGRFEYALQPALYVVPQSQSALIDSALEADESLWAPPADDTASADGGEAVADTCGGPFTEGEPIDIAWVLPPKVPDPDAEAELRLETACGAEALTLAFADGVARTVIGAPDGAESGLLVAFSALNAADTCVTAAVDGAAPDCATDTAVP